jgi:hypothetical protein
MTLILMLCLIWFSGYLFARNVHVRQHRSYIIKKIAEHGAADWRWRKFEEVPYNNMLFYFWVPLVDFYPDTSFYEEGDNYNYVVSSKNSTTES